MKFSPLFNVLFVLCCSLTAQAQKDNYWSWTFNTPSTLLGGAVVGGSAGPSAIYYNPSLINREEVPQLSISASIISLKFLNVENAAGTGLHADDFKFQVQPRFLSYVLPSNNEKLAWEFAILSPTADNKEYTLYHKTNIDLIKRTTGEETYVGYLRYRYKFDEWFIGGGFSYQLSDRFFVGASSFVAVQLLKYQYSQVSQAYQEQDTVWVNNQPELRYIAQNSFTEELKYWDISLILKLGAQYKTKNDRIKFGLNFTLPNLSIYGSADLRKSYNRSNVYDNLSDAFTKNEVVNEFNEDVRTAIKTPFSISLGFQYLTANKLNSILITGEYFSEIDPYSIFKSNSSGTLGSDIGVFFEGTEFMNYYHQAGSVFNLAIGYKQYISPKLFLLGGFRTDYSSNVSEDMRFVGDQFKVNQIHLDKYHISLGPIVNFMGTRIITGLQYTYGVNQEFNNVANFAEPVEYIPQVGLSLQGVRRSNARATMHDFALFFGLILDI